MAKVPTTIEGAARAMLARFETLTTEEFRIGGDKPERDALRDAIRRVDARETVLRTLSVRQCEKQARSGIHCYMLPDDRFDLWCVHCLARFALEGQ